MQLNSEHIPLLRRIMVEIVLSGGVCYVIVSEYCFLVRQKPLMFARVMKLAIRKLIVYALRFQDIHIKFVLIYFQTNLPHLF